MNKKTHYPLHTLALAALLLAMMLSACGGGSRPSQLPSRPRPTQPPSPTHTPTQPALPNIDVVITEIELPSSVNRGQSFKFMISVKNNNLSGPSAKAANINVRATNGSMDVPVAATQFRDLGPQKPQQKSIEGHAPPQPGNWTLYVEHDPFGFKDSVNNKYEARLSVN